MLIMECFKWKIEKCLRRSCSPSLLVHELHLPTEYIPSTIQYSTESLMFFESSIFKRCISHISHAARLHTACRYCTVVPTYSTSGERQAVKVNQPNQPYSTSTHKIIRLSRGEWQEQTSIRTKEPRNRPRFSLYCIAGRKPPPLNHRWPSTSCVPEAEISGTVMIPLPLPSTDRAISSWFVGGRWRGGVGLQTWEYCTVQ